MPKPKPRSRARRPKLKPVDCVDAVQASCRKIHALAELLFYSETGCLAPKTITITDGMIADEIKKLHARLEATK